MNHSDHVHLLSGGMPDAAEGRPNPIWADFGSGQGAFTLAAAELLEPGGQIHSVDRDAQALQGQSERLKARYPGVQVVYHPADFTARLELPQLDGLVMANALHFVEDRRKEAVVRLVKSYLGPSGRMILVEYNVDRGNLWVPHPLSFPTWQELAQRCGFARTRLLARKPSRFLHEFYAAVSLI